MATLIDISSGAQQSDNVWVARSSVLVDPDDGYYSVIKIPRFAVVTQVWVLIATAYTAAGAILTIGFEGNNDTANTLAFMSNDVTKPTVAGLKRSYADNAASIEGKYFIVDRGCITITTDDQGGTAGTFVVCAEYVQIS